MVANAILQSEDNQWFYSHLKSLILDSITPNQNQSKLKSESNSIFNSEP
jgi:hypothetical protein